MNGNGNAGIRRLGGVLVQSERNLGFEGQPITFDNNFGQRFSSHRAQQIFILFREPFRKN